jgi:hypothetical protein
VPRRARRLASGKKVRSAGPSLVLVTAASGRQFQLITEAHDAITPIFGCGSRQRKAFRCPSAGIVHRDVANPLARPAGVHARSPHQTMRTLLLRDLGGPADQLPAEIRSADPSLISARSGDCPCNWPSMPPVM